MAVPRGDLSLEKLIRHAIPLTDWRAADMASLVVGATAGDHKIALSTQDYHLIGNTPSSSTVTDISRLNFPMPPNYVPGGEIEIVVSARVDATADTNTIDFTFAVLSAAAGAAGSDLVSTGATGTIAGDAEYTFTVTGTTVSPFDAISISMTTINADGDGSDGVVTIKATSINLDIRG